jgi:hypothetical protein
MLIRKGESMMAFATQARITPDELARMPDAKNFELVDGELVDKIHQGE